MPVKIIQEVLAVFNKDVTQEARSKYAINTVLAFVGSSLLLIIFSLKAQALPPTARSGLYDHYPLCGFVQFKPSFVQETDRNT